MILTDHQEKNSGFFLNFTDKKSTLEENFFMKLIFKANEYC